MLLIVDAYIKLIIAIISLVAPILITLLALSLKGANLIIKEKELASEKLKKEKSEKAATLKTKIVEFEKDQSKKIDEDVVELAKELSDYDSTTQKKIDEYEKQVVKLDVLYQTKIIGSSLFVSLIFAMLYYLFKTYISCEYPFVFLLLSILIFMFATRKVWDLLVIIVQIRKMIDQNEKNFEEKNAAQYLTLYNNFQSSLLDLNMKYKEMSVQNSKSKEELQMVVSEQLKLQHKEPSNVFPLINSTSAKEGITLTFTQNVRHSVSFGVSNENDIALKNFSLWVKLPKDIEIETTAESKVSKQNEYNILIFEYNLLYAEAAYNFDPVILKSNKIGKYAISISVKAENITGTKDFLCELLVEPKLNELIENLKKIQNKSPWA